MSSGVGNQGPKYYPASYCHESAFGSSGPLLIIFGTT